MKPKKPDKFTKDVNKLTFTITVMYSVAEEMELSPQGFKDLILDQLKQMVK